MQKRPGLVELCPGVRSCLIEYEPRKLSLLELLDAVKAADARLLPVRLISRLHCCCGMLLHPSRACSVRLWCARQLCVASRMCALEAGHTAWAAAHPHWMLLHSSPKAWLSAFSACHLAWHAQ